MGVNTKGRNPEDPSMADRLNGVCVGMRTDLEVSRHVFHGKASYIVMDPITFQSHRLAPSDYEIMVRLTPNNTLGETFETLVADGHLRKEDEDGFYNFILVLHRYAFLNLPMSDEKSLYRRFEARQASKRRAMLMSVLYLKIPLVDPSSFLNLTIRYARFLFSKWLFLCWLSLIAVCSVIAVHRGGDLIEPIYGILATQNLFYFWVLFVVLKALHEFGHAYACKHYGGHVPEMGVVFMVFTPCAYVDASAAWGFTSKRERLIVSLAGMYVESIVAAIALIVWNATDGSLVNSLAYQAFFLAGIVTVGFNMNPLMRFDGYYIFGDLVEIPNLRQQASQYVISLAKRYFLGIGQQSARGSVWLRIILVSYGIASSIYKVLITIGICSLIASKVFMVGMSLAVGYVLITCLSLITKVTSYLWWAEETLQVRRRAIVISVLLLAGLPLGLFGVPLPAKVKVAGVIATEVEHVVRTGTAGFIRLVTIEPGQTVNDGDLLLEMERSEFNEAVVAAQSQVERAESHMRSVIGHDAVKTAQEAELLSFYERSLDFQKAELSKLRILADRSGFIAECLKQSDVDLFLKPGAPVATICDGRWLMRTLLASSEVDDADLREGQHIVCRSPADPSVELQGTILRVAKAGSRGIEISALTHLAGERIVIDPNTGEANDPYFEVTIVFDDDSHRILRRGMVAVAQFDGSMHSIGYRLYKRFLRFKNRLAAG